MDVDRPDSPAPPVGHLEGSTPGASDRALEASGFGEALPVELVLSLIMSWKGEKVRQQAVGVLWRRELTLLRPQHAIEVFPSDTIGDLKQLIWSITSVPPERMKLLNLVKGKLPEDNKDVSSLGIPEGKTKMFMMVRRARRGGSGC